MKDKRYNRDMRLRNKLILVAATVFIVGGAGTGVAFAMQSEEPKQPVAQQQPVKVETEVPTAPVEAPVEQEITSTPQQQEEVPVEEPKFGEDNDNPGHFVVFDKAWLLTNAGVTDPTEVTHVSEALTKMSGGSGRWIYKNNGNPSLCPTITDVYYSRTTSVSSEDPVAALVSCRDLLQKYESGNYKNKPIATKWQILAGSITN